MSWWNYGHATPRHNKTVVDDGGMDYTTDDEASNRLRGGVSVSDSSNTCSDLNSKVSSVWI